VRSCCFFHGGGKSDEQGETSSWNYIGDALARQQRVVVVTTAYRIGILGFLGHPQLLEESNSTGRSNFCFCVLLNGEQETMGSWTNNKLSGGFSGMAERLAATRVVCKFLVKVREAFSVLSHLVSPSSAGLFSSAICESGSGMATGFQPIPLSEAYSQGENGSPAFGLQGFGLRARHERRAFAQSHFGAVLLASNN
jgi:para-nitrobenzyl esterase